MSSTLVTPYLISVPWGVSASNPSYIKLPIPVPSQISTTVNAASFTDGFPPSTMTPEASGGLPFFGQDMNGILYMVTAYCANFAAGKLQPWSSSLSSAINGYPLGALVLNSNGNGYWLSQVNGNTTNPDAGGAGWQPVAVVGYTAISLAGGSATVTLSALQAAPSALAFVGTLTANVNVVMPANAGQQWIIVNATSGGYTVTVSTPGGTPLSVPQTGVSAPTSVYSDGTNIYNTGVSTAGLAPINSPSLTGTPTAPTAGASSNTTQIATTAMVQAAISAAVSTLAPKASPALSGTPTAPTPALGDNSTLIATTAFVQAATNKSAQSLAANGYATLPGGLILQWGVVGSTPSSPETYAVTFPIPFPTACFSVVVTLKQSGPLQSPSTGVAGGSVGPAPTRTGFTGTSGGSALGFYWMATGY